MWPDEIPTLVSADIVRNVWHHSDGLRHDLGGWLETAFDCGDQLGFQGNPCYEKAFKTLMTVLEERGAEGALWEICQDEESYSRKFLAAAWNETMDRVGYEMPKEKRRWPPKKE